MTTELFIVIALLAMAVAGLVVGVANDAVNFMNSAIGSKAAPRKIIVIIAGLGILAGVTFSSNMMEVARKGIFHPEHFYLAELLIIFLAVMIQNLLLLDLFNTFGLPTSTTVSVVFGLFGGAITVSFIKISEAGLDVSHISTYINIGNVFTIIGAIFLSIIIAFIFGSLIQYLTRLLFTFDYKIRIKRYGSLWGGMALTMITYFILIKGAKGSSFMDKETIEMINSNVGYVILGSLLFWTAVLQLLLWFTKANILKFIVLVGTFALAMAFAANDLVNFIGAPLAGLQAYKLAYLSDNPLQLPMSGLSEKLPANTFILLASGAIMVLTLFISKKARTVTKTEINLGRQDEGFERFESYAFSRMIVRSVINTAEVIQKITPAPLRKKIATRFDISKFQPEKALDGEAPAFDLLRASVNLMVAAGLISFATSLKLPLSTTYVTFIVAMATALPDKAWGRESAVYRVSGVLTVVGGWFFTAILGAFVASIIALMLYYGGFITVIIMLLVSAVVVYRSAKLHKVRDEEQTKSEQKQLAVSDSPEQAVKDIFNNIADFLLKINSTITMSFDGVLTEDLKLLKKAFKKSKKIHADSDSLVTDVLKVMRFANDEELENGHLYAKPLGALHNISARLTRLTRQNLDYFDNNHNKFSNDQKEEITMLTSSLTQVLAAVSDIIKTEFTEIHLKQIEEYNSSYKEVLKKCNKKQFKRIQKSLANKKRSILYLNDLEDTKNIVEDAIIIMSTCNRFYSMLDDNSK